MLESYLKYVEILELSYKSDIQEIYICKHKETDSYLLLNIIKNKDLFDGIDLADLKAKFSFFKEIEETDETIVILSESLSYTKLSKYLKESTLTLTEQVNKATNIIELLSKLEELPNFIINSLINYENLVIDNNKNVVTTGLILFDTDKLTTSIEDILKSVANIIHIIFTRTPIVDDKLEKSIPPDILKIIKNCLEGNYFRISDLVTEYKSSSIYRLINPEKEEIKRVVKMRKSMTRKRIKYNLKTKGLLAIIILLPVIVMGSYKILKHDEADKDALSDNYQIDNESNLNSEMTSKEDKTWAKENEMEEIKDDIENDIENDIEIMDKYFNEEYFGKLNADKIAIRDYTKYHRGQYSLKLHNEENEDFTFLVSHIDFDDDSFTFMKNRTVNLSLWINSNTKTQCIIILELCSKEKTLTQVIKKVDLIANNWTLHNLEMNTKNGEYMNIFISLKPDDIIWVDTIDTDILK